MYRDLRGRSLAGVPRRSGGVPARPNLPPDDRASDQARLHRLRPGLVFQSLTTNALSGVDVWRTILFVLALETALLTLGAIGPLVLRWDDAARRAIETVSRPLALPIEETAFGILEVADSAMERAIRVISIERGHDPRGFSLLAFGGAGPLHAVSLARRLAIPRVIGPAAAGVLSALRLLVAEVGHDLSQGLVRPLRGADPAALDQILLNLRLRGRAELAGDGIPEEAMVFRTFADLRHLG
jgi:N-methylhydantoinase A/oxoprolinase/acetone carboxylase beta subunit